ncbi:hypothetical protein RHGRI_019069 [Rhododendron griersonianum]|uniref:Mesoderm development candidate 2 n=1 Tax=Rhododendron griersonianum TaxID=479676 RepID=A0AAV6JDY8_9ERIC|nr:hypothetical protein RHGRI_019069 [Rhododendron griersonianum]
MSNQPFPPLLLLLLLTVTLIGTSQFFRFAEGGQRKIHITDDLDDVVDDEEDEEWKQWGKKPRPEYDPPPTDFSDMDLPQIQAEMMKRQFGRVFGFVKLRLGGAKRTRDMVSDIAMQWSKLSRTGAIETKFTGFDLGTIMFTMERGQDSLELKEFILNQPEAYEIKIGEQIFRRPGDPPFELLLEKLHNDRNAADNASPIEDDGHRKDEL